MESIEQFYKQNRWKNFFFWSPPKAIGDPLKANKAALNKKHTELKNALSISQNEEEKSILKEQIQAIKEEPLWNPTNN